VYPTRGEDRWIAISLWNAADEERLMQLAGGMPIDEWTASQDAQSLVASLQAAGIAAGVVQDIEDLIEGDAPLRERGALVDLPHPRLGVFGHVRTPITFSRDRAQAYRAPAIGEHNREIAMQVAGLDADHFERLVAARVMT
jgi:crotonobetainyl-CoA:carnitine CoA-transferase CaiB-like acyl-CoA transferase